MYTSIYNFYTNHQRQRKDVKSGQRQMINYLLRVNKNRNEKTVE